MEPPSKTCTKCGKTLPATVEFFHRRSDTGGLTSACKVCRRAASDGWKQRNEEKHGEAGRRRRERMGPGGWTAYCRESAARWKQQNPERVAAYHRTSRARRLRAPGSHTGADVRAQYDRQNGLCYYCGEAVGGKYHVDHVIPLARGGSNSPDNLVIACPRCNQTKYTKLPHECSGRLC